MLSIIVCSKEESLFEKLKINIINTIGYNFVHEILHIKNQFIKMPISKVYNEMAQIAKYSYLLFIHEDLLFNNNNWGYALINVLEDQNIGVVGLAGTQYMSNYMGTWPNLSKFTRENIWNYTHHYYQNPNNVSNDEVVVLDGVFLACKKNVWEKVHFSEYLTGFHCYDMDFCIKIKQYLQLKCVVTYEIEVNHFSSGKLGFDWLQQQFLFFENLSKFLPIAIETIHVSQQESEIIKRQKLDEFFKIFCFQYNGEKRVWILSYFLINLKYLWNMVNCKLLLRYVFFGTVKNNF